MKTAAVILTGLLVAVLLTQCLTAELCPQCSCPASYEPVCGFNTQTRRYRGFSNRCELNCSNKCHNKQFVFRFMGRCGKARIHKAKTV